MYLAMIPIFGSLQLTIPVFPSITKCAFFIFLTLILQQALSTTKVVLEFPTSKRVLTVSRTDSQESLSDWGKKKSNLILAKIRKFKSLPNLTRIFAMKRFQRGKRSEENILFVTKGRFVPIPHANLGEQFKRDLQTLCIKNITSWVSQQILWHCHKQRALAIRFYKMIFFRRKRYWLANHLSNISNQFTRRRQKSEVLIFWYKNSTPQIKSQPTTVSKVE